MVRRLVCLYLSLTLPGCQTLGPTPPKIYPLSYIWNGKIYIGDSKRMGVAQSLTSPAIMCSDPAFDRMACMNVEDYTALMQYFIQAACVNQ